MKSHYSVLTAIVVALCHQTHCAAADYLQDVKPLLQHKCYACHGALRQQGGLRLDTGRQLLQGGDSGSPVAAGEPSKSLLMDVLTGDAGFRMPPESEGAPLTEDERKIISDWIADGAHVPAAEEPQSDPRGWWSLQPVTRPPLPDVADQTWPRNGIDHFVAAAREARNLPHTKPASGTTWLRRVYLDLIGLPPTREDLHRYLNDKSPGADERVVDELLSRPQYGERWGRHWMDIWRYSDWYGSRGINEIRYSQRHIWRWRDWIVRSLNADKGYDRMIQEMLAADEIDGGNPDVLPATGYLGRNWYKFDRNVWMFETVERTGEAFLGLTLRCCRCHDHKFDPVTQEEYYRFRAFFEPHDVRTDRVSALTGTQKDATLGQVLNDGIAMVYDKNPQAETWRFERGDGRYPDKSRALAPGVPAALGGHVDIQPVRLPPTAWYPALRTGYRESLIEQAEEQIAAAEKDVSEQRKKLSQIQRQIDTSTDDNAESASDDFLVDDFSKERPDAWEVVNGDWKYVDGKLVQSAVTGFATMVTKSNHPADFKVLLRYRPLSPGTYRSIGFSFDYQDKGNSQDVYTSTGDTRQTVQAFHRVDGKQTYPSPGIVDTKLVVEEEAEIEVSVVGQSLTIDLNGERKLDYQIPLKRRDGRFALWVHQGAAEFLQLKISPLVDSPETLQRKLEDVTRAVKLSMSKLQLAAAELKSVETRLAAETARLLNVLPADNDQRVTLSREASLQEKQVAILRAEIELLQAAGSADSLRKAEERLTAAQKSVESHSQEYAPLGEQFPQTSTGRRKALAEWITRADNPRTARVAVNHIWNRHFGRPLVDTPENFGLNGRSPSHPMLMDWLASELTAGGWKMKRLHRMIVLSSTYRMSTSADFSGDAESANGARSFALQTDPQNVYLWRMNSRRMEAEIVRDASLHLAGRLDLTIGGPEIEESAGEKTLRRSLYFRNTPNEKMPMLEAFDVANPNGCYRRKESVVPVQSLAMMNSGLTQDSARTIAEQLRDEADFVVAAFETVLNRPPTANEAKRCRAFLVEHPQQLADSAEPFPPGGSGTRKPSADPQQRARENLVHVLFLHNDFVTIR